MWIDDGDRALNEGQDDSTCFGAKLSKWIPFNTSFNLPENETKRELQDLFFVVGRFENFLFPNCFLAQFWCHVRVRNCISNIPLRENMEYLLKRDHFKRTLIIFHPFSGDFR